MRELDELLARYLQSGYGAASETEKAAFRELLDLSDPELIGYLLGSRRHEDPDLADAIEKIRSCTQT
jgi:succinate dehydrogenase flavin-adding protein (antitoxin of CptAB toxin-antitoxin module)